MMNIIAILFALALDRFTEVSAKFRCFQWFRCYIHLLQQKVFSKMKLHPFVGMVVILLPVILVVGLLQLLLFQFWWGVLGWVFNFALLFYCLGNTCLRRELSHYFEAVAKGDYAGAYLSLNLSSQAPVNDPQTLRKEVVKQIFIKGNRQIFVFLFWFVLLGGVGVMLYRLFLELLTMVREPDSLYAAQQNKVEYCVQVMDWVPVRLVGVGFALAGSFMGSFTHWLRMLVAVPSANDQILIETGLHALNYSGVEVLPEQAEIEAVDLVERVLTLFLVIIALLTLSMWLG